MVGKLPWRVAGAVAAAVALAPTTPAAAQSIYGLADEAPAATEYSTPDGAVRFVLDRRTGGRAALVRFQNDPEVHVLRPVMGRNGDEIYRSASGDVQLRVTPHGGVVVYTRTHPDGSPAGEDRAAEPLAPAPASSAQAFMARLQQLQSAAARRLGRPVAFVPPQSTPRVASGVILDAAERAADGIAGLQSTEIRRVVFMLGPEPRAAVRGDTLFVQVVPSMGYAGRPSSASIRSVVQRAAQGPEQ